MSTTTAAVPVTQTDLNARNAALFRLLQPHRETDVMQRITLFVVSKTGKKLADYVNDQTVPFEDRIALINEITEIAQNMDWSKLPTIPKGQAAATPTVATPPPAPKPAAPKPYTPPAHTPKATVPIAATPDPVAQTEPGPEAEAGSTDKPKPTDYVPAEDEDEADPIAAITAQLRKLATQPKAKAITEADVRRIVRQELATVFTSVADVLKK